MRRSIGRAAVAVAVTFVAGVTPARAQLSLAGGPTMAVGTLADAVGMGYHAQGSFGLSAPLIPVALRVDAAWNQFPEENDTGGDFRLLSGTVNAVFSVPSIAITPYVIGGVGAYSARWSDDSAAGLATGGESSTEFGANAGVGVRLGLGGLSAFAEARFHHLFNDGDAIRFVPVSVGLRF